MNRWGWLAVGFLLLPLSSPTYAGEKPQPPSAKEIKALIDQLVSPNRKPDVREGDSAAHGLPSDFDSRKQQQVNRAISKLTRLGPQAFPFLIERWGDERYCLTASDDISGAFLHKTVGQICRAIIFNQLQPYGTWPEGYSPDRTRRPPRRPGYPGKFLGSQQSAKRWWQKNKDKTLHQMQLAALDWVIAAEAKRPRDFRDEERKKLQSLRKKLMGGGKPLPVVKLGSYDGYTVEERSPKKGQANGPVLNNRPNEPLQQTGPASRLSTG
jgi:hypothetical protein